MPVIPELGKQKNRDRVMMGSGPTKATQRVLGQPVLPSEVSSQNKTKTKQPKSIEPTVGS